MTKHRESFATIQRTNTPDGETLMSFIHRAKFIYATKRTKAVLDVLAKAGLLKRTTHYVTREGKRKAMCRYTLPPKNVGS